MAQLAEGLSVIIPACNEDAALPGVLPELLDFMAAFGHPHEIILVDDGSTDNSWRIIESFAQTNPHVRGIALERQHGQHTATIEGVRAARYATSITMDADGQHPVSALPALIRALAEGYDVAYGFCTIRRHGPVKAPSLMLADAVLWLTRLFPGAMKLSSFRVFRTGLRDYFAGAPHPYVNLDAQLRRAGRRLRYLPVAFKPRLAGQSHYNWSKRYMNITNLVTSHSLRPIRLIGALSVASTITGIVLMVTSTTNPWWLTGVFSFLAGLILFAVSLVGEYAGRSYLVTTQSYSVDTRADTGRPRQ